MASYTKYCALCWRIDHSFYSYTADILNVFVMFCPLVWFCPGVCMYLGRHVICACCNVSDVISVEYSLQLLQHQMCCSSMSLLTLYLFGYVVWIVVSRFTFVTTTCFCWMFLTVTYALQKQKCTSTRQC